MAARVLPVLLLVSIALAACGGGGDASADKSTTSTSVRATTSTTAESGDAALAAYRSFWDAFVAAGDPMNPAFPDLEKYATGDELDQVRSTFTDYFGRDLVLRGSLELHPKVTAQSGRDAAIHDCYLDRTHLFHAKTGKQEDPPAEPYYEVDVGMTLVGGQWKVARIDKRAEGCTP